ncbi:hypothetical protein Tco_0109620 [Tanacetum coccineum]
MCAHLYLGCVTPGTDWGRAAYTTFGFCALGNGVVEGRGRRPRGKNWTGNLIHHLGLTTRRVYSRSVMDEEANRQKEHVGQCEVLIGRDQKLTKDKTVDSTTVNSKFVNTCIGMEGCLEYAGIDWTRVPEGTRRGPRRDTRLWDGRWHATEAYQPHAVDTALSDFGTYSPNDTILFVEP